MELAANPSQPDVEGLQTSFDPAIGLRDYLETSQDLLRERQVPVIQDLISALEEHGSSLAGYISGPTGMGKGFLAHAIIRAIDRPAVIAVPTVALVRQFKEIFEEHSHTDDLGKIDGESKQFNSHVTITTYSSLINQTKDKASPFKPEDVELLILDEAHRALGQRTTECLEKFSNAIKIGFTATDHYSDERAVKNLLPKEIHKITIPEAIDSKLISPFSVWAVKTGLSVSRVNISSTDEFDTKSLMEAINNHPRNKIAVGLYEQVFAGQKAIFSCSGKSHVDSMAEALARRGIRAEAIHSDIPRKIQKERLQKFKQGELEVLVNDGILAEGFDDPEVGAVFNISPTLSIVRQQQRSGRALRINPNKPDGKHAIIVEFIDEGYKKAPIIFSHPKIAGAARLGGAVPDSFFDTVPSLGEGVELLTNPVEVEELTQQFVEQNRILDSKLAPENWQTTQSIADSFDIPVGLVKKALRDMPKETVSQETAKFRAADGGRRVKHYSPQLIEELQNYIDFPELAPDGWLSYAELEGRYGNYYTRDVLSRMMSEAMEYLSHRSLEQHKADFSPTRRSSRKRAYFSPECVEIAVARSGIEYYSPFEVPNHWVTKSFIKKRFGPNASLEALESFANNESVMLADNCLVEDGTTYYSHIIIEAIDNYTSPYGTWETAEEIVNARDVPHEARESVIDALNKHGRLCYIDGKEERYMPANKQIDNLIQVAIEQHFDDITRQNEADNAERRRPSLYLGAIASFTNFEGL